MGISADNPPVITAKAVGHVTITAADGTADVTVYPGPYLPIGTVKWSQPGDGSGVYWILPAVPSEQGVADCMNPNSFAALPTSWEIAHP
ncbi:MAG: hypothetical protein LAN64_07170 [Acidobacteriia bacterium]|nr:hypothetical protein [Terriglobia bacterium]